MRGLIETGTVRKRSENKAEAFLLRLVARCSTGDLILIG